MNSTLFSKNLPNPFIPERHFNPKMSNIEKEEEFSKKIVSNLSDSTKKIMSLETKEHVVIKKSEIPNAPWVFLFGWAGCQDRYLTKYSQIYEKNKYSIVRYTAPIKKIRSFASYTGFAHYVYDRIFDHEETTPIYFHVFSMNGCSLFVSLWDLLTKLQNCEKIKSRVKGIIFDSCPANVMPWQAADAISFATLPPSRYSSLSRNTYRMILTGFLTSHRSMIWLQSLFDSSAFETNFAFFRLLKITDIPKNQLYLYSKKDVICSDHSIKGYAEIQKEKGSNVQQHCWDDTLHVEHLRIHQEEYSNLCRKFIDETIEIDTNSNDSK